MIARSVTARNGPVHLAGTLWLPGTGAASATALLTMHPGSGPSDRDNDVFFPPIRAALLNAGVAVASFDKRGVGGSSGSWLDIGIEEQALDLLAGHAAATAFVPGVQAGVFGHSQGGWVVLEALRRSRDGQTFAATRPAFGVMSSGPGVTTAEQERFAAACTVTDLHEDAIARDRALRAASTMIGLYEAGASHAVLLEWATANPADVEHITQIYGELPDAELWSHFVRLAAYDPVPAMEAVDVPLLTVFGSEDTVTPVEASIAALRKHVAADRLHVATLAGGNHRLQYGRSTRFVPGYPDVVVDFVTR